MIACLTFAGTWAAPGVGYPSDVARACADVVEEIPVQAPWSFGPIPPGDFRAPSYQESVQIAVDWAVDWTLSNVGRPVIVGGYSQGAEAASRYRMEFEPDGRLAALADRLVAGYCFGNPSRHLQHTFYGGPTTPFDGIAGYRLPPMGWEWCELVDPADLYATSARGLVGEIERDVYTMCTAMEMHSGAAEFCQTFIANLLQVVRNLDGDAYDDLNAGMARHGVDVSGAPTAPPDTITTESDKLLSIQGIAAAIAAAIDGLLFLCQAPPTAPHIQYHQREVFPGQTYLQLGIQHVRDWATRHPT